MEVIQTGVYFAERELIQTGVYLAECVNTAGNSSVATYTQSIWYVL